MLSTDWHFAHVSSSLWCVLTFWPLHHCRTAAEAQNAVARELGGCLPIHKPAEGVAGSLCPSVECLLHMARVGCAHVQAGRSRMTAHATLAATLASPLASWS
jgi:hypothetical protein